MTVHNHYGRHLGRHVPEVTIRVDERWKLTRTTANYTPCSKNTSHSQGEYIGT